jgi:hypothetical protein
MPGETQADPKLIEKPASKEKEEHEELKKCKKSKERFLEFASKGYMQSTLRSREHKKKTDQQKHTFNSPTLKDKENIEN